MEWLAGRIMLLSGARRALVAFVAGLIAVFALPPFGIFAAPFLSFPILVWLLDGASGNPGHGVLRRGFPAFWIGWCFGFGYFLGGLWWLGNALLVEADDFAWAVPLAVLGVPAFLALFYALATAVARILWSDGLGRIAALAFAFGLFEWLRSFVLTGFPWNAIGYAAMPVPLMMQSAAVIGLAGVNMLAVFVFAAPALIGTRKGLRVGLSLAVLLVAAHFGYGFYRLAQPLPPPADPALTIRLVQPLIDQSKKIDDNERMAIFEEHLELTQAPPADGGKRPDIVVWPETAVPFILTENPDALLRISDVLQDGQLLIAGAVRAEASGAGQPPRYYNSIYVIDDRGQIVGASDKVHLVPFGEYLPLESLLSAAGLDTVAMPGGFSAAATRTLLTLPGGKTLYPLICYEAIFPGEIGMDALQGDALLNLTNDAWFGNTPGPYQHFQQARLRSVETGLPLIRDANTGISAVINGRGEIVTGFPFGTKGFVDTILPGKHVLLMSPEAQERSAILIALLLFGLAVISRASFILREN
ncbi:apolipoprotein N-acyltransferase [Rhizobium sp. LjRoot98]|uniref:apolipoprotein N-acyltransferase n=1 Tax=unclassified Rhizobium TaxID=2613769 RepID=UPI0007138754|nr:MULTISPECIES: apolipoprotein N-acyltransferase [unclassified Rhizobium]KQV42127.1 acyltransferase [Rhizobium sp. Root1204]KQY18014.1 acyltransferase [Rhizobium sp. Root1334]KRB98320.1 acyltransferase [Rhizobium sp. Root73]